jgi:hypothetical protein
LEDQLGTAPGRRQQGSSTNRRPPWQSSNSTGCPSLSRLHPSTQAQAPASESECSVPGQPNIARSPALRWSLGVCASFCACCDDIHIQSPSVPPLDLQIALSQQFPQISLLALLFSPHNQGPSEVSLWTGLLPLKTAFPRPCSTEARDGWISTLGPTTLNKLQDA